MGKKSRARRRQATATTLAMLDRGIESSYNSTIQDVDASLRRIKEIDRLAEVRARNKLRREMGLVPYAFAPKECIEARVNEVRRLETIGALGSLEEGFKSLAQAIVLGARLVAMFVLAIFRCTPVLNLLPRSLVTRLDSIYHCAMSVQL